MTSRASALSCAALVALLLTGCGADDTGPTEGGVTSLAPESGSPSASPSPSQPGDAAPTPGEQPPLLSAAMTAAEALPDATVVSVEDADDDIRGWEVEVVQSDGSIVGLVVAPEGGRVTLGPSPTEGDDDLVALAGRAEVGVVEALDAALQTAPEGVLESVQLEDEDGAAIWQVDLVDAGGVRVDAATGEATPDD